MELLIFVYGCIIGSFLNVCIYRIPIGISIIFPPSTCPVCGRKIKHYDLVPVISFLFLRGKCRNCQTKISFLYPVVELLTGVLTLILFLKYGISGDFAKYSILIYLLIVISGIDLRHQIIPDVLSIPGIVLGLVFAVFSGKAGFWDAIWGALFGGGILFLVAYFYPEGMGLGDAKLLAMVGCFLGFKLTYATFLLGSFLGTIFGCVFLLLKLMTRKTPIPFGPFLAAGAIISLFLNDYLLNFSVSNQVGTP